MEPTVMKEQAVKLISSVTQAPISIKEQTVRPKLQFKQEQIEEQVVSPKLSFTPEPTVMKEQAVSPKLSFAPEPTVMKEQAVSPKLSFAPEPTVMKEQAVSPKFSVSQPIITKEQRVRLQSSDNQDEGVIKERAVIQESSVLPNIETPNKLIEPIVFILHAKSDRKFALKLAEKLEHAGCIVTLSCNFLRGLGMNYHKALTEIQQQVDFVVFVLTNALLEQIFPHQGNPYCLMYSLCFEEYSRALLKYHKARPVCKSYEIVDEVSMDPILKGCFHINDEFDMLVKNMFGTKKKYPLGRPPSQNYTENKEKLRLSFKQANNRFKENQIKRNSYIAKDKIVLFIANQDYKTQPLSTPIKDVTDLAEMFQSLNFKVIVTKNLTTKEMRSAVDGFCSLLVPNSYGVFFFAGHGQEKSGQTYLLPVDYNGGFSPNDCICKEDILKCMQGKKTSLNAFFLDCCRGLPHGAWDIKEPTIANMRSNTAFIYATTFSNLAFEKGENSFLTKGLKKHMCKNYSIQKLAYEMQKDSNGEPYLNLDFHSSLDKSLKLCDPVSKRPSGNKTFPWKMVQEETFVDFPDLNCTVVLRIANSLNGTAIEAFLETKENFCSTDFLNMKMNIFVGLRLVPFEGFHLKKIPLQPKNKYFIFAKKILDLEKMKNQFLNGCIIFSSGDKKKGESEFCIWLRKLQIRP
ncbi:hypothetical protein JTE90_023042 [Oedothorax gibbosus]|uniref:Caspase family p20 domain-containing protein n=1 Tax=Oedothorax gibbosus TaxID=931172 RepID=A0AAV6V2Q8_9ARAC|nr:hypothetical protein JTE90_023042 [Oedothorax gibbosus]